MDGGRVKKALEKSAATLCNGGGRRWPLVAGPWWPEFPFVRNKTIIRSVSCGFTFTFFFFSFSPQKRKGSNYKMDLKIKTLFVSLIYRQSAFGDLLRLRVRLFILDISGPPLKIPATFLPPL